MNRKVDCILSIDWEGNSLADENLLAMKVFNEKNPQIPKVQFLNPAYSFNLPRLSANEISQKIEIALGPNDELGLHIHPWENFVKAAGVEYRSGPSYLSSYSSLSSCSLPLALTDDEVVTSKSKSVPFSGLFGGDVPLTAYTSEEIEKLIAFSFQKLNELGFSKIKYFRGGGWVSGPKVFRSLLKHGIQHESSPVPPEMISGLYPETLLQELARRNWRDVELCSKPYWWREHGQEIALYPNNVCLADYVDENQALEYLEKLVLQAEKNHEEAIYFHFGWHQESAAVSYKDNQPDPTHYIDRVDGTIERVLDYCDKNNMELRFPRLSELLPKPF